MEFSKSLGDEISLDVAVQYVKAHCGRSPKGVKAIAFGATHFQDVLSQEGCVGIRIYNGYNEEEDCPNFVVVGVDAEGKDMTSGKIFDRGVRCPDMCDIESPLFQG